MMTRQGRSIPKIKRNFFGERPSFLKMVHEKVDSFKPNLPQTSSIGGINMEKLNVHTNAIITAIQFLL